METESDLMKFEAAQKILERKRYSVAPEYCEQTGGTRSKTPVPSALWRLSSFHNAVVVDYFCHWPHKGETTYSIMLCFVRLNVMVSCMVKCVYVSTATWTFKLTQWQALYKRKELDNVHIGVKV